MTTTEETDVAKFVLWGGPEDGMEIEVLSGNLQVVVDSPSAQSARNRAPYGSNPVEELPPVRKARYIWNKETKHFEWKGYQ